MLARVILLDFRIIRSLLVTNFYSANTGKIPYWQFLASFWYNPFRVWCTFNFTELIINKTNLILLSRINFLCFEYQLCELSFCIIAPTPSNIREYLLTIVFVFTSTLHTNVPMPLYCWLLFGLPSFRFHFWAEF